jgi:hypothetical protein
MNATLSTTAWVLHDLGLATSVGGAVFGKAGLRRAMHSEGLQNGRGEIISEAWKRFTPINLLSHLSVGVTWLIGRSFLSGREVRRSARKLVLVKDALTGVYLVSGLASTATGYAAFQVHKGKDSSVSSLVEDTAIDEDNKPRLSRNLQRASTWLGTTNLIAGAALLGITAVLAMQAGRSTKWSVLSRFLP